jgi:hypothetical protein
MGTKYQSKSIRRGMEEKIDALNAELDPTLNPLAKKEVSGWQQQHDRLKKEQARLKSITPPEIKGGDERQKLELRNEQIKEVMVKGSGSHNIPAMPSVGQMQDNPDYSTDQHRRWENTWKTWSIDADTGCLVKAEDGYGAIFEWKDAQYRLHSEEDELASNFGSIETFRPGHRVPLAGNHVPVTFALTGGQTQDGYDKMFPDHEPLVAEIAAGVYFKLCTMCGKKVVNKKAPFCAKHQKDFKAKMGAKTQEAPKKNAFPGKSPD